MHTPRRLRCLGALLLLVACQDAGRRTPASAPPETPATLRIEWESGEPFDAEQFTPQHVALLESGALAVADGPSQQLVILDARGRVERSVPVRGEGPGEIVGDFRLIAWRDTLFLLANGMGPARAVWRLADGTPGGDVRHASMASARMRWHDRLADGSWLVTGASGWRAFNEMPRVGERLRDSVALHLLASDPTVATPRSLLTLPLTTQLVFATPPGHPVPVGITPLRHAAGALFVASDSLVWCVWPDRGTVQAFRVPSMDTVVTTTLARTRLEPDTERAALRRELALARSAIDSLRIAASFEGGSAVGDAPVASALIPSWDGGVWLELWPSAADGDQRRYLVLDRTGRIVRQEVGPAGVRLLRVGPRAVIGMVRHGEDAWRLASLVAAADAPND